MVSSCVKPITVIVTTTSVIGSQFRPKVLMLVKYTRILTTQVAAIIPLSLFFAMTPDVFIFLYLVDASVLPLLLGFVSTRALPQALFFPLFDGAPADHCKSQC